MTDRELLTKAAKAAGYTLDADCDRTDVRDNGGGPLRWNPKTDDGDSMRLAVRLKINVTHNHQAQTPLWVDAGAANYSGWIETFEDESQRADLTRLAILQAAAEMADAPGAA
jgi:hypothetical protein